MQAKMLFQRWKMELGLFSKKDILLLFFSFARTFKSSIIAFLKYFFWLFALETISWTGFFSFNWFAHALFPDLISSLFIFFYILSVRPVVDLRNIVYFYKGRSKLLNFILFFFAYFFLIRFIVGSIAAIVIFPFATYHNVVYLNNHIVNFVSWLALFLKRVFYIPAIFYLLFLLDDVKSVHKFTYHIKKSFNLLFLFFPILFIFAILFSGIYFLDQYLYGYHKLLGAGFNVIISMIFMCLLSVFFLRVKNRIA